MEIQEELFGKTSNGISVEKISLINNHGLKLAILTYGGIIQAIETPDEDGIFKDIVQGYDSIEGYEKDEYYMGAVVGPVAGRITHARIPINDRIIQLEPNAGTHQLHGGPMGLHKKVWKAKAEKRQDSLRLILTTEAKEGESGYPGNRDFKTTYILNNKNQLMIYFDATTDADTVVNMTSHSYFNLSSQENDGLDDHLIMINALKTLATDELLIPTGEFDYVLGKATNFSRGKLIGQGLKEQAEGFDHVYAINKEPGKFGITAKVVHQKSGRVLELVTNQPALVFYTNNYPDGSVIGKNGLPIISQGAFCIEPQHFPDSPNHPHFPSIALKAGDTYKSRSQFTFGLASDEHHH